MSPRRATVIALCVLTIVALRLLTRHEPPPAAPPPAPAVVSTTPVPAAETPASNVENQSARSAVVETPPPLPPPPKDPTRPAVKRDLVNPLVEPVMANGMPAPQKAVDVDADAARDFDKIALMLRGYRAITGENPTGTNAEIMKAIMGGNPRGAILGPPEGQSLNGEGELIDRWGTPYFFHELTSDLMEIRSAGPDRRMWNEDDITDG